MKITHFYDDFTRIVKNRAIGYFPQKDGGFGIALFLFDLVGDGGLLTSVDDLFPWDQNFYHNKLGKNGQKLIEQILTPGTLNNGKKLDYAMGDIVKFKRDNQGKILGFTINTGRVQNIGFEKK